MLFRGYRSARDAIEVAADGDVLWVRGPRKLATVFSAAVVRKGSDELIR